jgi:hypothetical protein
MQLAADGEGPLAHRRKAEAIAASGRIKALPEIADLQADARAMTSQHQAHLTGATMRPRLPAPRRRSALMHPPAWASCRSRWRDRA